jgi:hypothetical protein
MFLKFQEEDYLLKHYPNEIVEIKAMYECVWLKTKIRKNDDITKFWNVSGMSKNRPPISLIPRVTLRGGFIETYRLKFSMRENPDYNVYFLDVNSLYSYIAMSNKLPIGKYEVITSNLLNKKIIFKNKQYFFLENGCEYSLKGSAAFVTVTAPKTLLRPFLGYRVSNEYNFYATCRTCVEKKQNKKCLHYSDSSRSFTSSYMISELEKATELGYNVFFHELHFYKETSYVLRDFVQILANEKLQYTDLFKNIENDATKDFLQWKLLSEINQSMEFPKHLELYVHNVVPNDAKKTLIKNCLNSFFGRFALHNNRNSYHYCQTKEDFLSILDQDVNIIDFVSLNDNLLQIETECPTSKIKPSNKGCLYITSEINALARVFIYTHSETIEKKNGIILAIDTDSLLFALPKQESLESLNFEITDSFGHFKHVLGEKSEITDFFSLGPRNYSVVYNQTNTDGTIETKHVVKVKGLSLSSANCNSFVNPQTYVNMLSHAFNDEIVNIYIPQMRTKIAPTKDCVEILTEFNFTNELHVKRYIHTQFSLEHYVTFPYGYGYAQNSSPSKKRKATEFSHTSPKKCKL